MRNCNNSTHRTQPCKRACLHLRTANTLTILILTLLTIQTNGQPAVPKPQFNSFQPVNLPTPQSNFTQLYFQERFLNNPLQSKQDPNIAFQNLRIVQQAGMAIPGQLTNSNKQWQIAELKQEMAEETKETRKNNIVHFQNYLSQFLQLNPDNFSVTKAIYLSEAVYYDKPFRYQEFLKAIQQRAGFAKQILKQEGLSIKNGLAVHYSIQKLFAQDNIIHDTKANKDYQIKRLKYDFDDFMGEKDWSKMFVAKLLQTNSGQCHSLPLLYLCIAEQLNAKANLSLSPNHSFIQYFDNKGKRKNFETTNGNLVSINWLMQSNAISAVAYKNKTYLDTLSSKKLYAQILADLQSSYLNKNGYDEFSQQLSNKILSIDSTNINALMVNANYTFYMYKDLLKQYNYPAKEQFVNFPKLQTAFLNSQTAQEKVNQLGFQDMPKEQYEQWLKSIEREKKKQK